MSRLQRILAVLVVSAPMGLGLPTAGALSAGSAVDDSFSFQSAVAFDALANDTPTNPGARIASTTAPAHGTATCAPLGGCLYTANPGYVGPDSFQYTTTDDGTGSPTATVTLDVLASTSGGNLTAVEDFLAARAGSAGTVNVLANDVGGTGAKTVSSVGTSSHGATITCGPTTGDCTYTPAPGFSGTDGFTYDVTDATPTTKKGTVHVTVAPASATYALNASGAPSALGATWQVGASPTNVPQEAAFAPGLKASPEAPQAVVAGSTVAAPGWAAGESASQVTATPTGGLVGDSVQALFPPPQPPISQGTGGDGHVPVVVGSKVFAFFHHTYPTSVTCIDRATGAACPGYPKQLNVGGSNYLGPSVVVGSRLWTHLYPTGSAGGGFAQTASIALYCWDAATNATCGLTVVDRATTTQHPQVSAPRLANGKMWFGGETGRLYCVDPATGLVCPSIATGIGTATFAGEFNRRYDSVAHGNRVYLSRQDDFAVACIDVAAGTDCAGGWSAHPALGNTVNLVTRYNTAGAADGICEATTSSTLVCAPDADATATETLAGWFSGDVTYSFTAEAETGSRTIYGHHGTSGVSCFDWTTKAACTGGSYVSGNLTVDKNGAALPVAYGTAYDGACVVALGDPGQMYTVDPAGSSPCSSLATGSSGKVIDLRSQRCDGSVGGATWDKLKMVDANLDPTSGDFDTLVVTVRDTSTGEVLATRDLVDSNGVIDLSGINPVLHPSLSINASAVSRAGSTAWDNGNWPKATVLWHADAANLCFRTAAPTCVTGPVAAIDAAFADDSKTRRATVANGTGSCGKRYGYGMLGGDGGWFIFGDLNFVGAANFVGPGPLTTPNGVEIATTVAAGAISPSQLGYWAVCQDGRVLTQGDAGFFGQPSDVPSPIVGMAATTSGKGYWLAAADGGVYSFGDAVYYGSMSGIPLSKPVVGMAATPSGQGYFLVASDGGIFAFGDATFAGSTGGMVLNKPIVGMAAAPTGGYWLVATDGGVFSFGAPFLGSMGATPLAKPVVGLTTTPSGAGYTLAAADGGIFAFGDAPFFGNVIGIKPPLRAPIVGIVSQ
jgi:hypothetical protein